MMYFPLFFDPTFIILIPALLLAIWAQIKVQGTFSQFSRVFREGESGLTKLPAFCWIALVCLMSR